MKKLIIMFCLIAVLCVVNTVNAIEYQMIDLGTLGGSSSYAKDINNSGQIVGMAYNNYGKYHAFLYENGTMTDILNYSNSRAFAINESGQIVGDIGNVGSSNIIYSYNNAAMKNIASVKALKIIDVPVPSISVQNRVVSKLNEYLREPQRLESIYQQKLSALTELKQSILQKAFAGKLTRRN